MTASRRLERKKKKRRRASLMLASALFLLSVDLGASAFDELAERAIGMQHADLLDAAYGVAADEEDGQLVRRGEAEEQTGKHVRIRTLVDLDDRRRGREAHLLEHGLDFACGGRVVLSKSVLAWEEGVIYGVHVSSLLPICASGAGARSEIGRESERES
jgi:hypothetical protein